MPNRLIREGWLDSDAISRLSPEAEVFFLRLVLAGDDAGRIDGRPDFLRSKLYPVKVEVQAEHITQLVEECHRQGLLKPYQWDGKPFIQLARVQRSSPCATSKFPDSNGGFRIEYESRETRDGRKDFVKTSLCLSDGIAIPSTTHAEPIAKALVSHPTPSDQLSRGSPESESESESESGTETESKTKRLSSPKGDWPGFDEFYAGYPKHEARKKAVEAWNKLRPDELLRARISRAVATACQTEQWRKNGGQFVPMPAVWLNGRRWEDEIQSAGEDDGLSQLLRRAI